MPLKQTYVIALTLKQVKLLVNNQSVVTLANDSFFLIASKILLIFAPPPPPPIPKAAVQNITYTLSLPSVGNVNEMFCEDVN